MNRQILFRGKRANNGKWVYGGYHKWETRQPCPVGNDELKSDEIKHVIVINSFADWNMPRGMQACEVIPETVGQYTGLTDKNGVKIFEGDIVSFEHDKDINTDDYFFVKKKKYRRNYTIEFVNTFNHYGLRFRNKSIHFPCKCSTLRTHDVEVIGNIHDNPELLER